MCDGVLTRQVFAKTFMGVYLTGVHLMGVYLINVYLTGVHLIGVYLTGVDFTAVPKGVAIGLGNANTRGNI